MPEIQIPLWHPSLEIMCELTGAQARALTQFQMSISTSPDKIIEMMRFQHAKQQILKDALSIIKLRQEAQLHILLHRGDFEIALAQIDSVDSYIPRKDSAHGALLLLS